MVYKEWHHGSHEDHHNIDHWHLTESDTDNLHIQREGRSATYRLTETQTPITLAHAEIHQKLIKDVKTAAVAYLPTDTIFSKYNFNKKYETIIPGR